MINGPFAQRVTVLERVINRSATKTEFFIQSYDGQVIEFDVTVLVMVIDCRIQLSIHLDIKSTQNVFALQSINGRIQVFNLDFRIQTKMFSIVMRNSMEALQISFI